VMYDWRSMHQHQANTHTKSKCNQICELDTSHLEAFFQADSGYESDVYCCLIQAVPLSVELVRHSVCLHKCACVSSQLLM